jgi:shikimate dehydrogenase
MEKLYGLIGYPLSHSFSARYFAQKFKEENIPDCKYLNFPIDDISEFKGLLNEHVNLKGLNVTIPYKEQILPFLDEVSTAAKEIGAVNTIKIFRESRSEVYTKGFNTDVFGFEESLRVFNVAQPKRALILGTGGASKAVEWVLQQYQTEILFASRSPSKENHIHYSDINENLFQSFLLVINTTPLGMYPITEKYPPLPYQATNPATTFFDLIYNPDETVFLKKGRERNCKTINGMFMLEQQAEKAWQIWNEQEV